MKYIVATPDMVDDIHRVLHTSIETVYPKYYPKEVVDFFCRHHSKEHIAEGIASGNMGVLAKDEKIVGTGCFDGNHITGVYVLPLLSKARLRHSFMSTEDIKPWGTEFMNWKTM